MPVYNGEKFISHALTSLCAQSFTDWKLLISDNCSTDKTPEICSQFVGRDKRISYVKQTENLGASGNFKFLLDQADEEFFMWASSDDEWFPDFILGGMTQLLNNENCGLAFSNMTNIDGYGRQGRSYRSFERFSTTENKTLDIVSYLTESESLGKANLIYSVFRTRICREAWALSPMSYGLNVWGSDCVFNLAAITLSDVKIDNRVLFKKRFITELDRIDKEPLEPDVENPEEHIFPASVAADYTLAISNVFRDQIMKNFVIDLMRMRTQVANLLESKSSSAKLVDRMNNEITLLSQQNVLLEKKIERFKNTIAFKVYSLMKRALYKLGSST